MLLEITIAVALLSCLIVAVAPRARAARRSRATVGRAAHRSLQGPRALRRALLTPVLGGPARMPQFRPAVAFAGGTDRFIAVAEAPVAASRRRPAAARAPVAAAASASRGAGRTKTRRPARTPEAAIR